VGIEQLPRYMQNNPDAYRDAIAQAMMGQQEQPGGQSGQGGADPFAYIGAQTFDPNMGAPNPLPDFSNFNDRFPDQRAFEPDPSAQTQDRLDSPDFNPYTQFPVSQNTQDIRDQTGLETPDFNERFVNPSQIGLPQSQFDDRFGPDPRFTDPSFDIPPDNSLPRYMQNLPQQYDPNYFAPSPYDLPGGSGRHGGRGNRSQVE
jgi:hypothetical protein